MVLHRFTDMSLPESPNGAQATVAVIDLRDGHLAFENTFKVAARAFNMRLKPTEQIVEVTVGNNMFDLRATDDDRPPEPIVVFGNGTR